MLLTNANLDEFLEFTGLLGRKCPKISYLCSLLGHKLLKTMRLRLFSIYALNRTYPLLLLLAMSVTVGGCFKDEPLNAECDILEASVTTTSMTETFFHESDTLVRVGSDASIITFTVRRTADLSHMAPRFRITDGATIEPASGSVHDFSQGPVAYTVTSEDRQWSRRYEVAFRPVTVTVNDTVRYDFEHYELDDNYKRFYVWYEEEPDGRQPIWASGNGGFFIANQSKGAEDYPTTPSDGGVDGGKCLRLMTLDTGPLGRSTGRPIAAGNMFLGKFNAELALRDALHSTEMGVPFTQLPQKVTGYYRYKPGTEYRNKAQQVMANRTDSADIYAVLYRNHDAQGQPTVLYGDNVLTSPLIVRKARIDLVKPTDEWTFFELPFSVLAPVDEELLRNRGYNLALVFAASIHGDVFEGAIGSTLLIDKVTIICSHEE